MVIYVFFSKFLVLNRKYFKTIISILTLKSFLLDNQCARLLFINLLLITFWVLLAKSEDNDLAEHLQKFNKKLFHKLIATHPRENVIATSFNLATLLVLLSKSAVHNVRQEIDKTFDLVWGKNNLITNEFIELLTNFEHDHIFIMRNLITIKPSDYAGENITLSANATIDSWSNFNLCIRSEDLSVPETDTELKLYTETHFKNVPLFYLFYSVYKKTFYVSKDETINMDFLHIEARLRYGVIPELSSTILEIPYADGTTKLMILLPFKNDGIHELENDLQFYDFIQFEENLNFYYVRATIPKFIMKVNFSLKDDLKSVSQLIKNMCVYINLIIFGIY